MSGRVPTPGTLVQVVAPDTTLDALTLAFVRDSHLRASDPSAENDYISSLIATSWRQAERWTRRALFTQQWDLVLDCFPSGQIVLPKPPVQSVDAITYVDEDGVEQPWGGSPLPYDVLLPSGPHAGYAVIRPAYDQTWPDVRVGVLEAVTVRFTCGYPEVGSPATADVPEDITHGRLLVIGELYKQRSESVHTFNQNPALIRARDLWAGYRVF